MMIAAASRTANGEASAASFWAIIPAGGAGTRLWPLSRAAKPKFLLPLIGSRSLLQQTSDRLARLAPASRTLVICGPAHAASIARQLPELPASHLVIEPAPRGSGPAIGLATALIAKHEPDAIVGSFAADHDVRDERAFVRAVRVAKAAAEQGWLTTIGLTPTRAETGYGYIERTDEAIVTTSRDTAFRAARFIEKPDHGHAVEYVASGKFLWNASMFVWRAGTLLEEIARLQPALYAAIMHIAAAWDTPEQEQVMAATWAGLETSTIDHGIMEREQRIAVVPAEMGWSDVGDWNGLSELIERDAERAGSRSDLVQIETSNTAVWSTTDRLIALVGLDNLIVVDTPDALLVAHRDKAQDVRAIVSLLAAQDRHDLM